MRTLDALPPKQGRKPKHQWDRLFNGDVNVAGYTPSDEPDAAEGEFNCTVDSFISQARNAAKREGVSLTAIKVTPDRGGRVGHDGTLDENGQKAEVLLDVAIQAKRPTPEAEAEDADGEEE